MGNTVDKEILTPKNIHETSIASSLGFKQFSQFVFELIQLWDKPWNKDILKQHLDAIPFQAHKNDESLARLRLNKFTIRPYHGELKFRVSRFLGKSQKLGIHVAVEMHEELGSQQN